MSKKFLSPINLRNLSSDPTSGSEGDIYYNTELDVIKIYSNGAWSEVGGSSIDVTDTAPSNPQIGSAWFDNTTGSFYVYDGTFWVEITSVITNPPISQEQIQDYVAPLFTHSNHINASVTYDDTANELLIDVESVPFATYTSTVKHEVKLGASIAKGQAVYVSNANGTNMIVSKASNNAESTSSKTMGLLETGGILNDQVNVVSEGLLSGLDTSTAGAAGDPVWLGTNGNLIFGLANKPVAPAHLVFIGIVTRKNQSNGEIFVKVQNGYELEELHNVGIGYGSSIEEDSVLRYDSTSSLWKNTSPNVITAKNTTEATIDAFTPVYINSQIFEDTVVTFVKADASQEGTLPANAITVESVPDVTLTKLVTSGIVTGVTLTGYSDNDLLYVANGGGFTKTRPTGSNAINPIARVLSVDNGTIYFFGSTFASSTNTLPNLTNNKIWLGSTGRPTETTLDTSVVPENSNLYFTDERAQDAVASMITNGIHSGVSVEYVDSSNIFNFTNTGVTALYGTTGEVEVSALTGGVTIGLPDQVVINDQLTVGGTNKGNIVLKNASGTTALELQADASGSGNVTAGTELGISVTNGPISISAASGSIVLTATNGEYLNSALSTNQIATQGWVSTELSSYSLSSHTHALDDISDVNIVDILDGQSLVWDSATSKWINDTISGGGSESDPIFIASEAYNITSTDTSNWNTAYGWGNHASAGYLTSYTETQTLNDVTTLGGSTSNAIEIINVTASSSPTTGALIVTGGVGIGEDLYVDNDVHVGGNIHITGSITGDLTSVDVTNLVVTDPLIYLAEGNPNDSVDIGIFAALNHGDPSYNHTGLIRDASDSGKWKLVSGLDDPTANVIDFTGATYDILKIGALEVTDSSTTRANLGLVIGNDIQAYSSTLAAVAGGTYSGDDSITTLGTISSGTWEGTKIDATHGGTNQTSYTTGDILYASATNTLSKLAATTDGYVLTLASGVPTWAAASGGGGLSTTTTSITTNSATAIESFAIATSRTAEAIIQITQGTDYYSSKVLFIHDGTNVKITEYAILESTTGAIPVTISAAINGSNVELSATITDAATTNATAKVILIEVAV